MTYQATPVDITLTNHWKQYSISLSNVKYDTDAQGVLPTFYCILYPTKNPVSIRFTVDDIQYVNN